MAGTGAEPPLGEIGLPALVALTEAAELAAAAILGAMNQPRVLADEAGWAALRALHDDLVRLRDRATDRLAGIRPLDADEAAERARCLYARALRREGVRAGAGLAVRLAREGWG